MAKHVLPFLLSTLMPFNFVWPQVANDPAQPASLTYGSSQSNIGAGEQLGTKQKFLNGNMDEVRVWDHPRTAMQIQDNMSQALAGSETRCCDPWVPSAALRPVAVSSRLDAGPRAVPSHFEALRS